MSWRSILAALVLVAGVAVPAAGQNWETPTFFAPRPHDDLGVHLIKPNRGDWGVVGVWRQSGGINLGVRGGIAGPSGDRSILIGAELFGPLNVLGPDSPLGLYWVTGIGAGFNGVTALRIPLGVSLGLNLGTGNVVATPYVHPRVALDIATYSVGNDERTDTDLNFDADLGVDVQFGPSLVGRFGVSLDAEVFGFGLAYRLGRRAVVR
jgi:hypothetical protein